MGIPGIVLGNKKKGKALKIQNNIILTALIVAVCLSVGCAAPMVRTQKNIHLSSVDACGKTNNFSDTSWEVRPEKAVSGLYPPQSQEKEQKQKVIVVAAEPRLQYAGGYGYQQYGSYGPAYGSSVHPGGNPWAAAQATEAASFGGGSGYRVGWWINNNPSPYPMVQTLPHEQPYYWGQTRQNYGFKPQGGHRHGDGYKSPHFPGQPPPRSGWQPGSNPGHHR